MSLFKKTAGDVFRKYYSEMYKLVQKSPFSHSTDQFELLCAMAFAADYSAAAVGIDRYNVMTSISAEMEKIMPTIDFDLLNKRLAFYNEIILGNQIQGCWYLVVGNINELARDPISKCVALLGDLLDNPDCIDDYYHLYIHVRDIISQQMFITNVMFPLFAKMGNYSNAICALKK